MKENTWSSRARLPLAFPHQEEWRMHRTSGRGSPALWCNTQEAHESHNKPLAPIKKKARQRALQEGCDGTRHTRTSICAEVKRVHYEVHRQRPWAPVPTTPPTPCQYTVVAQMDENKARKKKELTDRRPLLLLRMPSPGVAHHTALVFPTRTRMTCPQSRRRRC